MLNDKSRRSIRHLPVRRKWSAFTAGQIIRLPQSEVRGGWGAGLYDWLPWQIVAFDRHGDATLRSLADGTLRPISHEGLAFYEERMPFGCTLPTRFPKRHRMNEPYRLVRIPGLRHEGGRVFRRLAVPFHPRYC